MPDKVSSRRLVLIFKNLLLLTSAGQLPDPRKHHLRNGRRFGRSSQLHVRPHKNQTNPSRPGSNFQQRIHHLPTLLPLEVEYSHRYLFGTLFFIGNSVA